MPYALCLMRIVLLPYACEASRLPVAAAAQVSVFVLFFFLASTVVLVKQANWKGRAVAAKRRHFRHASTAIRAKPRLYWYQSTNSDAKVQILTLYWYKSANTDAKASLSAHLHRHQRIGPPLSTLACPPPQVLSLLALLVPPQVLSLLALLV
jgi:hypothetical protein